MERKEKLIKSKERVQKYGEVFTPEWLVKQMCDCLEDAWEDIDKTFLEPACGNGNFLVEILRRKLELAKTPQDILRALRSIYGIDILEDNVQESRWRMRKIAVQKYVPMIENKTVDVGFLAQVAEITERNILCGDSLKIQKYLENHQWDDLLGKPKDRDVYAAIDLLKTTCRERIGTALCDECPMIGKNGRCITEISPEAWTEPKYRE